MSWIDKMTVLGIRSFGVHEEDRQLIEFEHPLTLIVGKNGAGKTTIIECLKYATTGDMPLNSKGGAFVHDPRLVGESDVRTQVALKFSNIKGEVCSVKRSQQATLKGDKITLKTLDSVMTKSKSASGETVSITSKCCDINAEMVMGLGVSKAVLENVIFCHQEDSNWPLAESKVVKTRFDEIFASTRYIKALDKIKETRKELDKSHKEENIRLPYLEGNLQVFNDKQKALKDVIMKLEVAEESGKKATDDMIPVEKELKEKQKLEQEFAGMKSSLQLLTDRKKHLEEDIEIKQKSIQNIFGGSDAQLQQVIRNQGNLMSQKKSKLEEYQGQVGPIRQEIEGITRKKNSLILKQGQLQQEYKSYEDKISHRTSLILLTSDVTGVPHESLSSDETISENGAAEFEREIKKLVDNAEKSLKDKKQAFDASIDEKSKAIRKVWGEKTEMEEGLKFKLQAIKEKTRKIRSAMQEIKEMQSTADTDRLEELQRQLEKSSSELKSAEESFNMDKTKEKERKIIQMKSQHESELKRIDSEIMNMQKHEQSRTTLEVIRKQKLAKEETVRKIKRRNVDSLCSIKILNPGDDIDSSNFPSVQQMNSWIRRKESEENQMRKNLLKKKEELAKLTAKYDMETSDFARKKSRCKEIEDELFELCGSEDYESELSQCEVTIRELQQGKGVNDGVEFLYKEFLKKLRDGDDKSSTPCPLCHRLFDQISEIDELAQDIDQKLQMAPRKRVAQEQDLERKEKHHRALLQQKPAKEEMDKLRSEILPETEKRVNDLKTKISKLRKTNSENEQTIEELKQSIMMAQTCSNDLRQIESVATDIKDMTRRIAEEEAKIPKSGNSEKSFDTLSEEKQNHAEAITKYNGMLQEIREEIEMQTATLWSLKDNVNSLQSEKLKIAANVEKCKQLNESKKHLEEEIRDLENSCKEAKSKITPLKTRLESMEEETRLFTSQCDDEMRKERAKLQTFQSDYQNISRSNAEIQRYLKSGKQQLLEKAQTAAKKMDDELTQKQDELGRLQADISRFEKDIATCRDRQRDLDENFALRKQKKAIDDVTKDISSVKEKLSGLNPFQIEHEIAELQKNWHKLNREKEMFLERQNQLKMKVRETKEELAKDELKNADVRFRECKRKVTTTDLAIKDLDKYHRALDRAIMRYHSAKMFEINKIIKEIWTSTYCGQDIDYIEICSDEEIGSSKMGRRSYNYRLVKHSRGQKIDMRGRCSAGQKVLASLVIRLALAETFCIHCGILALDEPTTNLDRHHIGTLADALSAIIESRQMQRNFQLIVITHDEDFVDLLGHKNRVDHFFRILKQDGKSRIHKCEIGTLE